MNELLRDLVNEGHMLVYIDDILIFTDNLEEHRKIVWRVLAILQKNRLYLKPEKCDFEQEVIEYLGLIISQNKIEVNPIKIAGIKEWPISKNLKETQSFLGFYNFYWRFIKEYSHIAKPMTKLMGKAQ